MSSNLTQEGSLFEQRINEQSEGLTRQTSALETFHGGQFTLSTESIKPSYIIVSPPTQSPPPPLHSPAQFI